MALTADELIYIRSEIGTQEPPDDLELEDSYERHGSVYAVIAEVFRQRIAELLAKPTQFTIPGDYSENTSENLKTLRDRLKVMESLTESEEEILGEAPDGLQSGRLVRGEVSTGAFDSEQLRRVRYSR